MSSVGGRGSPAAYRKHRRHNARCSEPLHSGCSPCIIAGVPAAPDNDYNNALERRLTTRHRARTSVYVLLPGNRRRLCRARNLSATGVFVETGDMGLRKGQTVELAFAITLGTVTKIHRRTAVVAHVSRGGTGLMMENHAG